jgi:chromosome segregation ATPase
MTADDMRGKFDDLLFRSVELERTMREMRGHITDNLDQFLEREEAYWAIERTKLENQVAKMESRVKSLEDELFDAQVASEKAIEEAKTYAAQLQVYEKTIAKYQENKEEVAEKRRAGRPSAKSQ